MANVFDVAKYILEKHGRMTAVKLQKLCYYSQAWSLVWDEKPLFKEQIQAWINGPVVKQLYDFHKGQYSLTAGKIPDGDSSNLDTNQKDTINKVVEFYGQFDPQQLSDLTHSESPWKNARKGIQENVRSSAVISHASMVEYYSSVR